VDSRISALNNRRKKAFLPLTQKSRGDAKPEEKENFRSAGELLA
jgi:hypothetical protein